MKKQPGINGDWIVVSREERLSNAALPTIVTLGVPAVIHGVTSFNPEVETLVWIMVGVFWVYGLLFWIMSTGLQLMRSKRWQWTEEALDEQRRYISDARIKSRTYWGHWWVRFPIGMLLLNTGVHGLLGNDFQTQWISMVLLLIAFVTPFVFMAELALLPFIESAVNPQAVSTARATGMWQFMPATGKSFDLKQNAFRDDRRDVLASTRAALDYLQRLHNMFGDWHLALAAYNWGEGNVGKALARNQRSQLGLTYTDLNMPTETRYYVPKLQAVKNIVAMPQLYNLQLPHIPNHPYFQTVPLTRDIDVTLAAKLADISVEDFKSLNPSAHRPVLLAAGTPQLLLPWDNAEIFMRNFAQHGEARMASWTAWVTPHSIKVAEAAKRAGMPEADFRALNGIPPHMLIKSGSALLVPRTARMEDDVSPAIADNGRLDLSPEGQLRRLTVKAKPQDNLDAVAARYKVTATQLAEWNKLSPRSPIKAGQTLVVYVAAKPSTAKGPAKAQAKKKPTGKSGTEVQTAKAR